MTGNLLERFLSEECTEYVRALLESAITDPKPRIHFFEFNLFEVTIDQVNKIAVLDDVLDHGDRSVQRLPLGDFADALKRRTASRGSGTTK